MRYEALKTDLLKQNFNDYSMCEEFWTEIEEQQAKDEFEIALRVCKLHQPEKVEILKWENAISQLALGQVILLPFHFIREKTTDKKCPLCGCNIKGVPAISRIDNKTALCSDCGTKEAIEDYYGFKDGGNE